MPWQEEVRCCIALAESSVGFREVAFLYQVPLCVATVELTCSSVPVLSSKATTWSTRLGTYPVRTASDCKSLLVSSVFTGRVGTVRLCSEMLS
jgi:hypothetical protein